MEFDPLAKDIAPPRHEIESDSEEEEIEASDSGSKRQFVPPLIEIEFDSHTEWSEELLVVCSEGGESYLQTSQGLNEAGRLLINGEQQGAFTCGFIKKTMPISVLLLRPSIKILSDQANFAYISAGILSHLHPERLTILDDYNAALYITTTEGSAPPIRKISSESFTSSDQNSALFESPNYIIGLAAALMNEASITKIPSSLYMLPQSTNPHLQTWSRLHPESSSLDTKPNRIDGELASKISAILMLNIKTTRAHNGERTISTFLDERRANGRHKIAANLSAMYV